MANTKQAKKATRKIVRKTQYNKWWKNQIKSAYKTVVSLISSAKAESAKELSILQKKIDKATKAGVVHKNKARRMKSAVMKKAAGKKLASSQNS